MLLLVILSLLPLAGKNLKNSETNMKFSSACTTFILATLLSLNAHAAVLKSYDASNGCDLYRVSEAQSNGKIKLNSNEVIIYPKEVYGLSFQDMEINFENREVLISPMMNIILGMNRPIIKSKAVISADNKEFNFLINQLNRKVNLFEKVCINDTKIVYAKMFEPKPESIK